MSWNHLLMTCFRVLAFVDIERVLLDAGAAVIRGIGLPNTPDYVSLHLGSVNLGYDYLNASQRHYSNG